MTEIFNSLDDVSRDFTSRRYNTTNAMLLVGLNETRAYDLLKEEVKNNHRIPFSKTSVPLSKFTNELADFIISNLRSFKIYRASAVDANSFIGIPINKYYLWKGKNRKFMVPIRKPLRLALWWYALTSGLEDETYVSQLIATTAASQVDSDKFLSVLNDFVSMLRSDSGLSLSPIEDISSQFWAYLGYCLDPSFLELRQKGASVFSPVFDATYTIMQELVKMSFLSKPSFGAMRAHAPNLALCLIREMMYEDSQNNRAALFEELANSWSALIKKDERNYGESVRVTEVERDEEGNEISEKSYYLASRASAAYPYTVALLKADWRTVEGFEQSMTSNLDWLAQPNSSGEIPHVSLPESLPACEMSSFIESLTKVNVLQALGCPVKPEVASSENIGLCDFNH